MVKCGLANAVSLDAKIAQESSPSIDNNIAECTRDENGVCIPNVYHDDYISVNNYIMNPYNHAPSGGGTQHLTESDVTNKGL